MTLDELRERLRKRAIERGATEAIRVDRWDLTDADITFLRINGIKPE